MSHDRRRLGIHIDEYQRTFWTWAHPLIRQFRDRHDSRTGGDDGRLLGLRVGGDDVHHVAGP
jgi:hypothetical protein